MPDLNSTPAPDVTRSEDPRGRGRAAPSREAWRRAVRFREGGVLLALVVLAVLLTVGTSKFLTTYNLGIVVRQISFVAIVAMGQTLVLLTGGINLSVGPWPGSAASSAPC